MTKKDVLIALANGEKLTYEGFGSASDYIWFDGECLFSTKDKFNKSLDYINHVGETWELYKEPAPEPEPEKTLEEIIYNAMALIKIGYENESEYVKGVYADCAKQCEAEVLRRYHESLPKIEGKERGQILYEKDQYNWNTKREWVDEDLNVKLEYAELEYAILAAYQLAPSEPEPETAIDRLFNSGFEKPKLWIRLGGSYQADFNAFGRGWVGYGDTPEQAAAVAIDQFKNFIAGK